MGGKPEGSGFFSRAIRRRSAAESLGADMKQSRHLVVNALLRGVRSTQKFERVIVTGRKLAGYYPEWVLGAVCLDPADHAGLIMLFIMPQLLTSITIRACASCGSHDHTYAYIQMRVPGPALWARHAQRHGGTRSQLRSVFNGLLSAVVPPRAPRRPRAAARPRGAPPALAPAPRRPGPGPARPRDARARARAAAVRQTPSKRAKQPRARRKERKRLIKAHVKKCSPAPTRTYTNTRPKMTVVPTLEESRRAAPLSAPPPESRLHKKS